MVTTTEHEPISTSDRQPIYSRDRTSHRIRMIRRGVIFIAIVAGLAVAVFGDFGTGRGSALKYVFGLGGQKRESNLLTHTVRRGRLRVTVTEDGNVESASNVDVKCQVAGGATILWIVEDGKEVSEGEVIVRLDESAIIDQINAQTIIYQKAMATKIQAEEDLAAAQISVKEYEEGMYIKELQTLEAQIFIAKENLRSAENMLNHSRTMARKGFNTPVQVEADEFAVERSKLELESAITAKRVLQDFTKEKTLKQLEALRDSTKARMDSEQAAFELEKARLERLQQQLTSCTVKAPANGMVVWANDNSGRRRSSQQTPDIEEGAIVREGQSLIKLPDLTQMQVKVGVHETKVEQIQPGFRARVQILDRAYPGEVIAIANQPEPGSWYSSEIKQYGTTVKIAGEHSTLKPGMTAEVEIMIADLKDVLTTPVQAVVEQRGKFYCWVLTSDGPERRPVVLGRTNDRLIEIKDGLVEGEEVVLNPRAMIAEARDDESSAASGPSSETDEAPSSGPGGPGVSDDSDERPRNTDGDGPIDRDVNRPPEQSGDAGASEPGRRGERRGGDFLLRMRELDKDGDQKISREEAPDRMQQRFEQFDLDGNGFIEMGEFSERMRQRSGEGGRTPPGDRRGEP